MTRLLGRRQLRLLRREFLIKVRDILQMVLERIIGNEQESFEQCMQHAAYNCGHKRRLDLAQQQIIPDNGTEERLLLDILRITFR